MNDAERSDLNTLYNLKRLFNTLYILRAWESQYLCGFWSLNRTFLIRNGTFLI